MEFTHALPRQNFEEYIDEELVQHSYAAALLTSDEEQLRAMILQFDAVVRLVGLEMEQVFCEEM